MENISEQKENFEPILKLVSREELLERIYKGESVPQDVRFLPVEQGGVFKYFDLGDIMGFKFTQTKRIYPLVEVEDKIVAISELEQDPNDETNFWIKFVSTDPTYQGNGYATKLIGKMFEFAKENHYSLEPSVYTEEGGEKLKKVVERVAKETGVKIRGRLRD